MPLVEYCANCLSIQAKSLSLLMDMRQEFVTLSSVQLLIIAASVRAHLQFSEHSAWHVIFHSSSLHGCLSLTHLLVVLTCPFTVIQSLHGSRIKHSTSALTRRTLHQIPTQLVLLGSRAMVACVVSLVSHLKMTKF